MNYEDSKMRTATLNTVRTKIHDALYACDLAEERGDDEALNEHENNLSELIDLENKLKAKKLERDFLQEVAAGSPSNKAEFDPHKGWTFLNVLSDVMGYADSDFIEQASLLILKAARGLNITQDCQKLLDDMAVAYGKSETRI